MGIPYLLQTLILGVKYPVKFFVFLDPGGGEGVGNKAQPEALFSSFLSSYPPKVFCLDELRARILKTANLQIWRGRGRDSNDPDTGGQNVQLAPGRVPTYVTTIKTLVAGI